MLSLRRRPPPDLDMIEDGFVLTEEESEQRRLTRRIINRRSKKVILPVPELSEEEYVQRCKEEASNMLLGVRKKIFNLFVYFVKQYRYFSAKILEFCFFFLLLMSNCFSPRVTNKKFFILVTCLLDIVSIF